MSDLTINEIASKVITLAKKDAQHAYTTLESYTQQLSDSSNLLNNLGLIFYQHVEYELARRTFVLALKYDPKNHSLYNNLGLTLNRLGQGAEAIKQYKKALKIKPEYHQARSNLAYTLLYFGTTGRKEILTAHKNINQYVFPDSCNYLDASRVLTQSQRQLRIAYVSADLRNHAVGSFMHGILSKHDTQSFAVFVLDNRPNNQDDMAKRLQGLNHQWIDISKQSTEQVCQLVVDLKIDILIDLSGHTKGGRPDVFSQRSAPIQMTYLGYPATTGLSQVDYRIGDNYSDPIQHASQNTEQVLRLNHAMWNYTPWAGMPTDYSACPFEQHGVITFGSANNHAKLQEAWLKVWAKVLNAVPDSQFHIKSRSLKSPTAREHLLSFFQNQSISAERIHIEHYSPQKEDHWRALQGFDIALDSFPYNGTTTTCDLLNLGVPIATRSGNSHVSRTTGSILNTLGLSDWVADSDRRFVDICVAKANDRNELRKLRQSLATRFRSSTLGNAKLFLVDYEFQLKRIWREYCQQAR